jgi:hypothetical protein
LFYERPIPAEIARRIGLLIAPENQLLVTGGVADPKSGRGIEIFPKQSIIGSNGFGNQIWLPWWWNAPAGSNEFYEVTI